MNESDFTKVRGVLAAAFIVKDKEGATKSYGKVPMGDMPFWSPQPPANPEAINKSYQVKAMAQHCLTQRYVTPHTDKPFYMSILWDGKVEVYEVDTWTATFTTVWGIKQVTDVNAGPLMEAAAMLYYQAAETLRLLGELQASMLTMDRTGIAPEGIDALKASVQLVLGKKE